MPQIRLGRWIPLMLTLTVVAAITLADPPPPGGITIETEAIIPLGGTIIGDASGVDATTVKIFLNGDCIYEEGGMDPEVHFEKDVSTYPAGTQFEVRVEDSDGNTKTKTVTIN